MLRHKKQQEKEISTNKVFYHHQIRGHHISPWLSYHSQHLFKDHRPFFKMHTMSLASPSSWLSSWSWPWLSSSRSLSPPRSSRPQRRWRPGAVSPSSPSSAAPPSPEASSGDGGDEEDGGDGVILICEFQMQGRCTEVNTWYPPGITLVSPWYRKT